MKTFQETGQAVKALRIRCHCPFKRDEFGVCVDVAFDLHLKGFYHSETTFEAGFFFLYLVRKNSHSDSFFFQLAAS